ncbi:hypothetical protein GVAV_000046 [Gurleya vavrai]
MSYDTQLAIFSPDGRLLQVERAQHASEQGALVVFSKNENSIMLALEKRISSKMLIEDSLQKIFLIDNYTNIFMSYCGISADALCIRKKAILICRQYKYDTGEDINIVQLAQKLAEEKQRNTIEGEKRPFGMKTLLFGYYEGFRLFTIDPDGNYTEFKKGAIGAKSDLK